MCTGYKKYDLKTKKHWIQGQEGVKMYMKDAIWWQYVMFVGAIFAFVFIVIQLLMWHFCKYVVIFCLLALDKMPLDIC